MEFKNILAETRGRVGLIRLNRPKAYNALNSLLLKELTQALQEFEQNGEVGAVVITGDDRAFASGADIQEMSDMSSVDMLYRDGISSAWDRIAAITKPVIAAVSGWCLGGGHELAMACDMIIASESAKFGQPEINLGIIPGAGGTQRLTRTVGKAIAMEMVLNNRTLTAEEAQKLGLVNHVYPVDRYLEEALNLAASIAERAPVAIRLAKHAVNHALETHLQEGIQDERRAFYFLFSTDDQKEGMQAFLAKRKAQWVGK